MVAELISPTQEKPKRKMPVSTGRPKGSEWLSTPVPARLRIRSLYLVQGLEPSQIVPKIAKEFKGLKLDAGQISALCTRNGWTKEKRAIKEKLVKDSLQRTQEQVEEVVSSTAMLAEEGSIAGLERAIECTKRKGKFASKDFAAWAAGSRQLVAIARQARGLDAKGGLDGDGNAQINVMFVGALPRSSQRSAVNVTPAAPQSEASVVPASGQTVDVQATPSA